MRLNFQNKGHNFENGFTLVEIIIVILIVSVLSATAGSAFLSYREKTKIFVTKERLKTIQESMEKFLEIRGRYPCPAPFIFRPQDANFGLEGNSHPDPNGSGCLNTSRVYSAQPGIPGGAAVTIPGLRNRPAARPFANPPLYPTPRFNGGIKLGLLPVRTLNLPDEFATDAWGGALTYAVMVHQATNPVYAPSGFLHDKGGIRILDAAGNSLITPADTAHYVVVSHGKDQKGARAIESNQVNDFVNPCPTAASGELQIENCDDDSTFVFTSVFDDVGANAFDDIGIFQAQRRKDNILPSGTILPFDASQCPQGWIDYMDGNNRGRFLMGVTVSGAADRDQINQPVTVRNPVGLNTTDRGVATDEYFLGDSSEDGSENIPAYLALRYCIKQ